MARGNTVTVVGNLTRDPELRYTPSGTAVCNFGVAWNKPQRPDAAQNSDRDTSFFDVTCWDQLADNVASSLFKGMRVVVSGRLDQRSWETSSAERRSKVEIVAEEVAPSLRWASAEVVGNPRSDDMGGQYGQAPQQPQYPQLGAPQYPQQAPQQQPIDYSTEPF